MQMIRLNKLAMAGVMLVMLSMLGCGDLSGPGSNDVEYTGMYLSIDRIVTRDADAATPDIDVCQEICTPATATAPAKLENFTEATMDVTLNYQEAFSCANQECPAIYIKSYTVVFSSSDPKALNIDPVQASVQKQIFPGSQVTLAGLLLMPLNTKIKFEDEWCGTELDSYVLYNYKVTVKGVTEFGEQVTATGVNYFTAGNFLLCQ
jgi:hypothetical protein